MQEDKAPATPPVITENPNGQTKHLRWWRLAGWVLLSFATSLSFRLIFHLAECAEVSPAGGPDAFFTLMPAVLCEIAILLACCFAFVAGCILCCWRRTQFVGLTMLACSLSYGSGCASQHLILGSPRSEAFQQLGERMMPLVHAIESYHQDHGVYPEQLASLVPTYLDRLPATGMGNYTNYNYYVGERAQSFENNPWIIEVPACHGMGFDQFYYFPRQNYPDRWPYERLGQWAYFHE